MGILLNKLSVRVGALTAYNTGQALVAALLGLCHIAPQSGRNVACPGKDKRNKSPSPPLIKGVKTDSTFIKLFSYQYPTFIKEVKETTFPLY